MQTTSQTISRQIERADALTYQELEQLLLTYPQEYGTPVSQPLLERLILPRLDRLATASSSPSSSISSSPNPKSSSLSPSEEYLLLTQILLRQSPSSLTSSHLIRYADLLDNFLQPLLPTITSLLNGETSPSTLTHLQTTILRGADLYAYLGPKAQTLQSLLA